MLYTPFHQLKPSMNLVISHSVMEAMFHLTMTTMMISPHEKWRFFPSSSLGKRQEVPRPGGVLRGRPGDQSRT
jgi:hypothetical protein